MIVLTCVVHDVCCSLQELSCSLRKTNPGVSLTIMAVEGDLSSSTQLEVKKHGSLLLVDDIKFANFKLDGRSAATEHMPQYLLCVQEGFCLECSDFPQQRQILHLVMGCALGYTSLFCNVPHF